MVQFSCDRRSAKDKRMNIIKMDTNSQNKNSGYESSEEGNNAERERKSESA